MKNYPKLFILLIVVLSACSEDDDKKELTGRQLLVKYDWITYTFERDPDFHGEPELTFVAWSFTESTFSVGDFDGQFYDRGDWSLEEDSIMVDDEELPLLELSKDRLVYENSQGAIITRLPVKKIDR